MKATDTARILGLAMLGVLVCWVMTGCTSAPPSDGADESADANAATAAESDDSPDEDAEEAPEEPAEPPEKTAPPKTRLFGMAGYPPPAEGRTDPTERDEAFFPLIDRFGQYAHREWPGKIRAVEDLERLREAEKADLAAHPGPGNWNRYGGWATGPKKAANAHFRVIKDNGWWWLVDPEGRLFFSHGISAVRAWNGTPLTHRVHWFQSIKDEGDEVARFLRKMLVPSKAGYYEGMEPMCFDYAGANLFRKYGRGWRTAYPPLATARLRSWGFNTIGGWSAGNIYLRRKLPYVVEIHFQSAPIEGDRAGGPKFKDPFEADFERALGSQLSLQSNTSAGDSRCIGYFVDSDQTWDTDNVRLAVATLNSPAEQAAKKDFLQILGLQYNKIETVSYTHLTLPTN